MTLMSKATAHYRVGTVRGERCGTCRFMNNNGTCELVQGQVRHAMVCDFWKAEKK